MSGDNSSKTENAPNDVANDVADDVADGVDAAAETVASMEGSATEGAATEGAGAAPALSELEQARREAEENHDRYLRAAAELSNFRKRTVKMRTETRDDTLRDVLLQIGPMLDNFRRALGQDADEIVAFREGIQIIFKQFNEILSGYGLVEIDTEGKPFDPNLHEAIVQVPSEEYPPGTVIQEMEKGYMLNDRVLRPARVIVSAAKAKDDTNPQGPGDRQNDGKA
ncbi:MAG: nucleotide exchange factor GrpE [bacterium]|nr:nucleotide exchange factor GrpE [bacterium]